VPPFNFKSSDNWYISKAHGVEGNVISLLVTESLYVGICGNADTLCLPVIHVSFE